MTEYISEKSYVFTKAILHFDGDSFFASVEQIMDYRLKGKSVITGGERGAVTSVSVEAKKRGLGRGMSLKEIKIRCPDAIVVPSDYRSYGIFAHRMYDIVRTYASEVEEYSVDECFADITGLDVVLGISYEAIAERIKKDLEDSLGITFGVGLAPTKTLAKIASKANKPAGLTVIGTEDVLKKFLESTSIGFVWGLGGASGYKLQKLGAETALAFTEREDWWLTFHHLGKPYRDIWLELRGESVKPFEHGILDNVHSLMRTRTFTPPSKDRSFVLSQLSKNVEQVCEKARNHKVRARGLSFYLKTQEFTYHAVSMELTIPVTSPIEVMKHVEDRFDEVFVPGVLYRASGITLRGLLADRASAPDLFGQLEKLEQKSRFVEVFDRINKKYGNHTLALASSLRAINHDESKIRRKAPDGLSPRIRLQLSPAHKNKSLRIPFLGMTR